MGFLPKWLIIRKQIKEGPLNINISKRGVGWSVGKRGERIGRNARGQGFFEGFLRGLSYRKFFRK